MRHKPHHPPIAPHKAVPLPRVRRLSKGVHFGLACVGILFVAIVAYGIWGLGGHR
jgi:hypothetical protein